MAVGIYQERMEFVNKFEVVARDDETILWTGNVDKSIYTKKAFRIWGLICLIPAFGWVLFALSLVTCFICVPLFVYFVHRSANNTFFCVTDKRVIKRYGVFKTDYIELPYDAIKITNMKTSIFDREEGVRTANLIIISNVLVAGNESAHGAQITISSLNHVDEAYKLVSGLATQNDINVKSKK